MRFFSAARLRRLPSYDAVGQRPTVRSRPSAASRRVVVGVGEVPVADGLPDRVAVEPGEVDPPGDDAVLDVVHGVGDVVGEVHHLRLEARGAGPATPGAQPVEDRPVVVVHPELATTRGDRRRGRRGDRPRARPGVLRAGVERGAGQVEPDRAAVGVEGLGLQPGQQPQRLGVALEAAARRR